MRGLNNTMVRFAAIRAARADQASAGADDRLVDLAAFGTNPGALRARAYVPAAMPQHAPLVVVLHGCTQNAAAYDHGSGWSHLADRHGFALLFPEQQRQNNPNLCFNWFAPDDARRGSGEALSIAQMTRAIVARHRLDPARVYVTGLSAGGAMTSVMLATYPELFAGGAIIAGLPFGVAGSILEALERMRGLGSPNEAELGALVRSASSHQGPWPRVSVWHGSADATVHPSNARAIVGQWRALHGVAAQPSRTEVVDGHARRVWSTADGRDVVEEYSIAGMGHGTPLATGGAEGCGAAGPHMLEAGISSTRHIARSWGLLGVGGTGRAYRAAEADSRVAATVLEPITATGSRQKVGAASPMAWSAKALGGVDKVIDDALRAAGLKH